MKNVLVLTAGLILLTVPALAQGGSPYNTSGSQAGGPAGGMGRQMGSSTVEDPNMVMPPRGSGSTAAVKTGSGKVMRKRSKAMKMKHGRMHGHEM